MAESIIKNLGTKSPKIFTGKQIHTFTENLCKTKRLGSGGFGDVYEGILPDGVRVAVKVLKGEALSEGTKDQLKAEVGVLCRTHHKNLVQLYGFCFEQKMTALVYEFMENKSLDTILYGNQRIRWETICNIAIGTAAGLSYLHKDCQPTIIHYDIKPSNILLDLNFTPKIGDFGLAKRLSQGKSHITLSGMRGTPIYVAPEMNIPFSPMNGMCDVFSFGITLFDLIGRRKHPVVVDKNWFPAHVWKRFAKKQETVIMEECGIHETHRNQAKRMLLIALQCVQFDPKHRPSMSCVLRLLEGSEEVKLPPNPFVHLVSSSGAKIEDSKPKVELTMKQEKKEEKNNEAHLYMQIKVARDEDLFEQIGRHILMNLHDGVWSLRLKGSTPFDTFKEKVGKKFGIPVQFLRFWLWKRNSDKSYRPTRPLTLKEEKQSVDQVRQIYNKAELMLFLEVQRGPDLQPIKVPKISNGDIMIFVKRYSRKREALCYVGRLFVDKKSKPSEVLMKLNVMAGFSSNEKTKIFMEISINSHLDYISVRRNMTFEDNKIINGDILLIDKPQPVRNKQLYDSVMPREQQYCYPDAPNHFQADPYGYPDIPYDIPFGNPYGPFGYPVAPIGYPDDLYDYPGDPYGYPITPYEPYYLRQSPMNISYRAEDEGESHRRGETRQLKEDLTRWMGKAFRYVVDG